MTSSKQSLKSHLSERATEWAARYADPEPRTLNAQLLVSSARNQVKEWRLRSATLRLWTRTPRMRDSGLFQEGRKVVREPPQMKASLLCGSES